MRDGRPDRRLEPFGGDWVAGIWTIVLAAGSGSRFGGQKQFASLAGTSLVARAVQAAAVVSDGVVVVLPSKSRWNGSRAVLRVTGGASRSESVQAGLRVLPQRCETVLVHDAAHPLASVALFKSLLASVAAGAPAAIPGLPVNEALKRIAHSSVVATMPRAGLVMAQMPQAFIRSVLVAAHGSGQVAPEDSELVALLPQPVSVVPGDPVNVHVTTRRDLQLAQCLVACGEDLGDPLDVS